MQWVATGERLTKATFDKYRKQGGKVIVHANPESLVREVVAHPVTMIASDKSDETALVLAIWNRPSERQPSRFGRLPSERVAEILAEPGVYSLTAFKVSR